MHSTIKTRQKEDVFVPSLRNNAIFCPSFFPHTPTKRSFLLRKMTHYTVCSRLLVRLAVCLLGIAWLCSSCNPARNLSRDETLYTGAKFIRDAPDSIAFSSALEEQVYAAMRPKPNASFLGWYYRLGVHNLAGQKNKDRTRGLRYWLRQKIGQPPVLLETVNPGRTARLIENRFYNAGFFDVRVRARIERDEQKRQGYVRYTASYKEPYVLRKRFFPEGETELEAEIRASETRTLLREGEPYDLELLKQERERVMRWLKERGFFYFSADFLLFQVDTTMPGRIFDLYMKVKEETPAQAFRQYRLNEIYVFSEFQSDFLGDAHKTDTTATRAGYQYVSETKLFRAETVSRHIFFKKGELYRFSDHQLTLQKLTALDVFKFVNVRFQDLDDGQLDVLIYLTPLPKKFIRLEATMVSKSNGFTGPGLRSNFSNRNTFHGLEKLSLDLTSSYETQIAGQQAGLNSYQVGGSVSMQVYRFITPFGLQQLSRFVPTTQMRLSYDLLSRVQFFRTSSFNALFGYKWRETTTRSHEFNPVNISYLALGRTSPLFDNVLANNQLLARSFENQFILGTSYTFTYNNQLKEAKKNYVYFSGNLDISGNTMHAVQSMFREVAASDEDPYRIFGRKYSHYARLLLEGRFYEEFSPKAKLALRGIAGVGVPLSNSSSLPYIKQFYIGGTNSLRGFPVRSVGPGSYAPPDSLANALFLDQVGDIKIEVNAELRYELNSFIKVAAFTDVGNIWLTRPDPDRPGGTFSAKNALGELAMSTGIGLRFDASYLIVRFDVGIPVRRPNNPVEKRWVFREIDFGSSNWRRENLVLNIAIGYPF